MKMYLGLQKPENKAQEVSANPQQEACGAVYIKQTVRKVMHKKQTFGSFLCCRADSLQAKCTRCDIENGGHFVPAT